MLSKYPRTIKDLRNYKPPLLIKYYNKINDNLLLKPMLVLFILYWLIFAHIIALCYNFYLEDTQTLWDGYVMVYKMIFSSRLNRRFFYIPYFFTICSHVLFYYLSWFWAYRLSPWKPVNSKDIFLTNLQLKILIVSLAFFVLFYSCFFISLGYMSYHEVSIKFLVDIPKYMYRHYIFYMNRKIVYYIIFELWAIITFAMFFYHKKEQMKKKS